MATARPRRSADGRAKPREIEHKEAVALMLWVSYSKAAHPELDMLFAIPNGGQRNAIVAAKLKAEGVKPGVPDYCLPVPMIHGHTGYAGAWCELKRPDGQGRISENQQQWADKLIVKGYAHRFCNGWIDAADFFAWYLQIPRPVR